MAHPTRLAGNANVEAFYIPHVPPCPEIMFVLMATDLITDLIIDGVYTYSTTAN